MLQKYQKDFIRFLLKSKALKFGDFTLKSGRKSPFFMNVGDLNSGEELNRLSRAYASTIVEAFCDKNGVPEFDMLFGPAYKGIPIAAATALQLAERYDIFDVRYSANRKEIKDHGDAGAFLGALPKDGSRILMIEDVTTSGASMEETIPLIKGYAEKEKLDVEVIGLIVMFDRLEYAKGDETRTALDTIAERYGIRTTAIANMAEVCEYLADAPNEEVRKYLTDTDGTERKLEDMMDAVNAYYHQYAPLGRIGREGDMYVK